MVRDIDHELLWTGRERRERSGYWGVEGTLCIGMFELDFQLNVSLEAWFGDLTLLR